MSTRLFYLLFFLFPSFCILAQTNIYHPFPSDSAQWGMYHSETTYGTGGQVALFSEAHYQEKLQGDTIINNLTYLKVYSNDSLIGALREDANRRVWFYGFTSSNNYYNGYFNAPLPPYLPNQEILLYDFGLSVGDSVKQQARIAYAPNDSIISKVIGIDSLQLLDGSYRRMLEIEARSYPDSVGTVQIVNNLYWVEGVGAIRGGNRQVLEGTQQLQDDPLEDNGLFGSVFFEVPNVSGQAEAHFISCYYENGNQILGVKGNAVCSDALSTNQLPQQLAQITLVPNPFQQQTTLHIESSKSYGTYQVLVYSSTGQLVQQLQSTTATLVLNRNNMSTGLYFYQLYGEQTLLGSGKMVIK